MEPDLRGTGYADPEIAGQLSHREKTGYDGFQFTIFELFDLLGFETRGFIGAFDEVVLVLRARIQPVENLRGPVRMTIGPGDPDDPGA